MMKRISILPILILLFFAACQKSEVEQYTIKFYGDARQDIGYSVAIASDGYIIAGQMELMTRANGFINDSLSNKNMAVIKTDWDGNIKWKVTAGGKYADMGSKVYQLADGSMICVGTYTDTTTSKRGKDILVVKISASGEKLWMKNYGGAGNQTAKDIIEATDGFIIIGTSDAADFSVADGTGNPAGKTNLYVLHISPSGDSTFAYSTGFSGNEEAAAIKNDNNGGFIVLGTTDRSLTGQAGNNLFVVRLNNLGKYVEQNIIGTADDEYASGIEVLQDGYLIAGTVGTTSTSQQAYVVKLPLDIQAAPVFRNKFTINKSSTAVNAIAPYTGGNFLLAGYINANPGLKMAVFEIGADGNPVSGMTMINGSTGDQVTNDVVSGDDGYIIAIGSNTYDVNSMISFLKFRF